MRRRSPTTLIAGLIAVVSVLALAGTVLAKEGAAVTLAQPIPRDAEPGSTLTVTFTVTIDTGTGPSPVYGSPVFVRLIAPYGTTSEGSGTEKTQGSGTYTADVVVPAGGIKSAEFGLRGTSTDASGKSVRSDELFEVHGWLFTTKGTAAGTATPAGSTSAAETLDLRLPVVVGLIAIVAAGLGVGLRRRRPLTTV
jgi:hypothetical protein